MSDFTDYQEEQFFNHVANIELELDEKITFKEKYEANRDKYPDWVTKDGTHIKVRDLTNSHLDNLLKFIPKKDPNNETKWINVIKCEIAYRSINQEIQALKEERDRLDMIIDTVF